MTESPRDCAALLEQADWVRRLARRLVADAHAAEDLAQDALAAALARPAPASSPRRWLAGVVRNLLRHERRSAVRRDAREREAARSEADVTSAELLERLEGHRAVVEAVARLAEPYRSTILMRYFEGLSPAAIAKRTRTPLRTVHTRLHRALASLRRDLARSHGEGDAWLLALLPIAGGQGRWSLATNGALLMETKLKIGVAVLAAVGVCTTFSLWRGAGDEGSELEHLATPVEAAPRDEARPQDGAFEPAPVLVTERLEVAATSAGPSPAAEPVLRTRLFGRVVDAEQAPVAALHLRCEPRGPGDAREAITDARGAFSLEAPAAGGTLDVTSPGWVALFRPAVDAGGAREVLMVVAPALTLAGRVRDEAGNGLAEARLAVPLPFHLRARFDGILDGADTVERATTTGADGRFELTGVPLVQDLELVTSRAAFLEDRRALPAHDEHELEIVLRRLGGAQHELGGVVLDGVVLDPTGMPVEGAWVAAGDAVTRSGPEGEFALELASAETRALHLRAVARGYLPAEERIESARLGDDLVELVLGPPPLSISGRVVDAEGNAVAGAEVWTDGETHFGSVPLEGGELSARFGASVEGLLRGDPWTPRVSADLAGRFELTGLLPRSYRLWAVDRTRLSVTRAEAEAGSGAVELRMPEEELIERLAGRVTDLGGVALAGVTVAPTRATGAGPGPAGLLVGRAARTDAAGRFELARVPRAVEALVIDGPELERAGFRWAIAAQGALDDLHVAVPLRVHARVDVGATSPADRASLLDDTGRELPLWLDHGEHAYQTGALELVRGVSESFSVSETAEVLVLRAGGEELARLPVRLVRGRLNTIGH